jgi:TonB family protein
MKLCVLSQGPLVYDDDSRLIHSLTKPGKLLGPSPQSIVPAMFEHGIEGKLTFYLSYVVEADGTVSSGAVVRSCGYKVVDAAAIKWINGMKAEAPGYLDFTPVRTFSVILFYIDFG